MAEIYFTIKNFNVLKVRLDPTEVRGKDVAGRPALCLPLKLQVLPTSGPQQQPGQQRADMHYVLLRLAGTLSSNPIGEFVTFEVRPLAEHSNPSPHERYQELTVALDRVRVKRFEDARGGADAHLRLSFSGLVWFPPPQSTFEAIGPNSELEVKVPKSHWVEQVVQPWGLESVKLVEITFPKSEAGENFRAAYSHVEAAERHFANGLNKQTLAELYSAFEKLAQSHEFNKPDQSFFVCLLSDSHPAKKEAAKVALDKLCDFLHLGRHEPKESPDTFQISRSDARFALVMAHAVFEYITPKG